LSRPFDTLFIANRGEIAIRVARSARALGLRVVGVRTAEDRGAAHLDALDASVEVGSYLDGPAIVAAAARLGAEAVHPGYGFLSENPVFAEAVLAAGLVWVGPPPAAIRAMGSKAAARRTMAARGVPVVPGYDGDDQSDRAFEAAAAEIGYPVLVKASGGGGGKGMRVVEAPEELAEALEGARRVARSAFGDARLLLERYLRRPRHIEAQVLADAHGAVLHLFERECSIQRRHQKVVEEAPSPAFAGPGGGERRAALLRDAVAAARAVGYENAGTVEFIVDEAGRHYFLEMNTRLQVEHPVTERITGLDLVALQLRVAMGAPLPFGQEAVVARGAAVEVRLYAEDPDAGYLPQAGVVRAFPLGSVQGEGLRVDAGVRAGDTVGIAFDPMLAKVVAWGEDRLTAIRRLCRALESAPTLGFRTNQDHLLRILRHPAFRAGHLHTGFLEEHALPPADPAVAQRLALLVAAVLDAPEGGGLPSLRPGFSNHPWPEPMVGFSVDGALHAVARRWEGGWRVGPWRWGASAPPPGVDDAAGTPLLQAEHAVSIGQDAAGRWIEVDGARVRVTVAPDPSGAAWWVAAGGMPVRVERRPDLPAGEADEGAAGGLVAPMPGRVVRVLVAAGDAVAAGAGLVVLEAMKMEQTVRAPGEGVVDAVLVEVGQQVEAGAALVRWAPSA